MSGCQRCIVCGWLSEKHNNLDSNRNVIESKSNVTYLGVTLDQFLSGEIIASNILYKSSNMLKFQYRNAGKFNLETKKTVDICSNSMSF